MKAHNLTVECFLDEETVEVQIFLGLVQINKVLASIIINETHKIITILNNCYTNPYKMEPVPHLPFFSCPHFPYPCFRIKIK